MESELTEDYRTITRMYAVTGVPDLPYAFTRNGWTWRPEKVEIMFSAIAPEAPSFAWVRATGHRVLKGGTLGKDPHGERWAHLSDRVPEWVRDMVRAMATEIGASVPS